MHTETRRAFLAKTAAAAGLAAAATAYAQDHLPEPRAGKPSSPPRDGEPIRMAVLGAGGMGTAHIHSILKLVADGHAEGVEIRAVCDVNDLHAANAKKVCDENQPFECDMYRNERELLARKDIHGVLIAVPEHQHAARASAAILAGKDCYLEKPMTLRLDEALRLRRIVNANPDKVFQVGTQMIMLPKYREAKKVIEAGGIGKPIFSQTSYCRNNPSGEWNYYQIDPEWEPGVNLDWDGWLGHLAPREWDPKVYIRWRRYRDFSTGIIGDLLVHQVTPLVMALESVGWPTRVNAVGGHYIDTDMENHDQVNLELQFEGGHTMIVAGSTNNEVGLETLIRGNKANIYLNSRHCDIRPERAYADDIDPQTIECPDIGNDQDQLRLNWFKCIRSRAKPESSVDLGTKVMVMVDLATRSMWEGKSYEFDPEAMRARAI